DWLIKYGYLTDSSDVTLFEHTMAIMNMQHFHKLPVTGVIDREEFNIMQRTRCGCPDMMADDEMQALGDSSTSVGQLERFRRYVVNRDRDVWPSNDLTYRFNDFTSDLPTTVQEEEMRKVASKWSAASRLSITRSSTSTSDIQVAFRTKDHGDNYPFDGPFDVLAHAFSPGTGLGGDIHFDDDEQFTINSATGADFTFIALHEMGHSLGLEHSNNPDAVMSMFFTNNPSDIQLHNDDIAGIQSLYGRPEGVEAVIEIEVATVPVTCTKVYDAIADVGASFFFFR
ncbi:putative matrilysin isoform X2, partial [Apostichopus japonicus]